MKSIQFIADNRDFIEGVLLFTLTALALFNDIKSYKIPNKLNFAFIAAGLALGLLLGDVKNTLTGMAFPLVLFPLFALRMLGAGDIKLFCAMGALTGFPHIVSIMAYSVVFNGIIALIFMVVRKNFSGFKKLFHWFGYIIISGKIMEYQQLDGKNRSIFRYAYGIMLGCLYYIVTDLILGGRYALL